MSRVVYLDALFREDDDEMLRERIMLDLIDAFGPLDVLDVPEDFFYQTLSSDAELGRRNRP